MTYSSITESQAGALGTILGFGVGLLVVCSIISIAMGVLEIVGLWKSFDKAGKHGWAAIIPIYNLYVLMDTAKLKWYNFVIVIVLSFVASLTYESNNAIAGICLLAEFVYYFVINIKFAKAFGKSAGIGVLAVFFPYIVYPIIGLGSAEYQK